MKDEFGAGLVVVGAGGHGRVVADIAITAGIPVAGVLDDAWWVGEKVNGLRVLGGLIDWMVTRFSPATPSSSAWATEESGDVIRIPFADRGCCL